MVLNNIRRYERPFCFADVSWYFTWHISRVEAYEYEGRWVYICVSRRVIYSTPAIWPTELDSMEIFRLSFVITQRLVGILGAIWMEVESSWRKVSLVPQCRSSGRCSNPLSKSNIPSYDLVDVNTWWYCRMEKHDKCTSTCEWSTRPVPTIYRLLLRLIMMIIKAPLPRGVSFLHSTFIIRWPWFGLDFIGFK